MGEVTGNKLPMAFRLSPETCQLLRWAAGQWAQMFDVRRKANLTATLEEAIYAFAVGMQISSAQLVKEGKAAEGRRRIREATVAHIIATLPAENR